MEFGTLDNRVVFSEIVGIREDGLIRRGEYFSELRSANLAIADLDQPFVVLAGDRVENHLVTRLIEVRHGPELTETSYLFPPLYNDVRDIALIDPVAHDDFRYLLVTHSAVHMMSNASDEPIWERPIDSAWHAVAFRPDPGGPTRLLVGSASHLYLLDPQTGDELDAWPLSGEWGLQVARLNGEGEQVLAAGRPPQGIVAFDVLAGESIWIVPSNIKPSLHVHDLNGDGRDEVLLSRKPESGGTYVTEWRDAAGAVLHDAEITNGFMQAVVFNVTGSDQPQVLFSQWLGTIENSLYSLDLQTRLDDVNAEQSNFSRFNTRRTSDGSLSLETVAGIQPVPDHSFRPLVRSILADNGALVWLSELDQQEDRFIVDIAGIRPGEPAWQFGSVYVLSRRGNATYSGRITELEAATGQVLRSRDIGLPNDVPYRLMALDLPDGAHLLLVTRDSDGTRYHLMNPQFLQIEWSSPSLPLGIGGNDFRVELADESRLLIHHPISVYTGTLLLDLQTGEISYDPGEGIVAATLIRDADDRLLILTQDSLRQLRIHDPDSEEVTLLATLDFTLTAMTQAGPNVLLLAETDRLHVFDLDAGEVICSSRRQGSGLGIGKGFVRDPSMPDRWLIGNRAGIHGLSLKAELELFADRFEQDEGVPGCIWQ